MVQFTSGNSARSFELRELAAAFLFPSSLAVVANKRRRALCNQSLAKCNFCKSFALIFMQNAGGVGGAATFQHSNLINASTFSIHPLCFDTFAHPSAQRYLASVFVSIDCALFSSARGCVPPRRRCEVTRRPLHTRPLAQAALQFRQSGNDLTGNSSRKQGRVSRIPAAAPVTDLGFFSRGS